MRIAIDIPNNLHIHDLSEIFTHLEAVYAITSGVRSGPIGFTAEEEAYIENDISALAAITKKKPRKQTAPNNLIPSLTKKEEERDEEIRKVLKSVNGRRDAKVSIARTCYKNLTKIYGIVWVEQEKIFKERWNVDQDVRVSKRRCVVSSDNVFKLYINQLKTMRDNYNRRANI